MADRWVCLDVGETLIDETRVWSTWADLLGVPRFTFLAAFGAALARGQEHRGVFDIVDRPDWRAHYEEFRRAYGGFCAEDLYPDALSGIDGLRNQGYRIAILANQPADRHAELAALGIKGEVMAMSEELGVHKPNPAFFTRALELMACRPGEVAYVGDRLDNDVLPASAAGMRAVWIRRGPWGAIHDQTPPTGTLVVDSLTELVERINGWWQ
jgi:FMN hydrolase / 5-amino-6-(5-phospho-D-ribitylamino)uracil phosphatase